MFSNIIWAWSSIKPIITDNKETIRALVPVGTIISLILSFMNSNHLKRQANLQREIEGNRYKIDLFDKRFKVYKTYESSVMKKENEPDIYPQIRRYEFLTKLKLSIVESSKCLLVFNISENNKIRDLLEKQNEILEKIDEINLSYERIIEQRQLLEEKEQEIHTKEELIDDIKDVFSLSKTSKTIGTRYNDELTILKEEKDLIENKISDYQERIDRIKEEFPDNYLSLCTCHIEANEFMKKNLTLPELAFEEEPWFFVKWWQTANTFKTNNPVIFWLVVVCVLFLGVLLCS